VLSISEIIICVDPAEALRSEAGAFEGMLPSGEHCQPVCRPGRSITSVRHTPERHEERREWLLQTDAELRTEPSSAA
jgi:hypothetical protein